MIGFWIFMLIMNLLIPVMMVIVGILFIKRPPREINIISGYRTFKSMKNKETWVFAHNYCGNLWRFIGLIMLPISVMAMFLVFGESASIIGIFGGVLCLIQCVFMIIPIIFTEKALNKKFDKQGNLKIL